MRRPWILAAAAAALCALGLWLALSSPQPAAPAQLAPSPRTAAPSLPPPDPPNAPSSPALPRPEAAPAPLPERALPPPPAAMEVDAWDVPQGSPLSREEVRAAIEALRPLLQDCFHDDAARYPGEQSVVLTFTVGGHGARGTMEKGEIVRSSIPDPWAQACFLDSLLDAAFPAPRGGSAEVTVPFRYVPGARGAGR